MTAQVKLSAEGGGSAAETTESGQMILQVPSGTEVTLTAGVDPVDPANPARFEWNRDGAALAAGTPNPYVFSAAEDSWGEYQVIATVNGSTLTSAAVSLTERAAEEQPKPDTTVAEVAPGEYDPKFALISGIAAGLAAVLTGGLLVYLLLDIDLPGTISIVGDNQQVTGTWAQRFSGILALVLVVIGAILIFGGLWLAALETRGRLRAQQAIAERGALDGVAEVLDKAKGLRGTIAVLAAGVAILVVASGIAIRLAGAESGADPQVNPSAPATPSASPTG
ncbi:hypothetical protein [Kribbella sp. NBC_00889]|uniref:hypothetical protein n=1 Tax=Kribbella sp. NBC_00889 TaxID=2975974 RepID=UPI00387036CD|nr:hypothetical protein OG817_30785 [Kribbella sp. NBC_00889]